MRERHFQSGDKHPRACTCAECHRKRLQALEDSARPKRRKPKSQRGKAVSKNSSKKSANSVKRAQAASDAVDEALRILGLDPDAEDNGG